MPDQRVHSLSCGLVPWTTKNIFFRREFSSTKGQSFRISLSFWWNPILNDANLNRKFFKTIDEIDVGDGRKFGYGFTYVRGGTGGLLARGRNGSDAISALHWQASLTFPIFVEWVWTFPKREARKKKKALCIAINKPLRNSREKTSLPDPLRVVSTPADAVHTNLSGTKVTELLKKET